VKKFFDTLELKEGGIVLLEENKAYKGQSMWSIKLRIFDDCEMLLQEVRYVPKLKRIFFSDCV